ncbi:response regulator [Candidatus Woesearchaeota archaeon]|nr:response regulator [Candidatus Woesearchaeota archaeon]
MNDDLDSLVNNKEKERKPRVLVIEDEDELAQLYSDALKSDYDVIVLNTGDEIYSVKDPGSIDVVVQDLKLPGNLEGKKLFQEVCKVFYDSQVIIATGVGEAGQAIDFRQTGAYEFLHKPVSLPDILNNVKGALSAKHNIREDLRSKVNDLSRKYKTECARYVLMLKKDRELARDLRAEFRIKEFEDIESIKNYIDSLKPSSSKANAVLLVTDNQPGLMRSVKRKKGNFEIPVVKIEELSRYDSGKMLEELDKGFFDVVPREKERVNVSLDYAFLAHQEKFLGGMSGEDFSLKQARKKIEKPVLLISGADERLGKNLEDHLISLELDARVVRPNEYERAYKRFRPAVVLLDPLYMVQECIREYDEVRGYDPHCSLVSIIPADKKQQFLDYARSRIDAGEELSADKALTHIGENLESLTEGLIKKVNAETKISNSMFFVLEPEDIAYSGSVAEFATQNKIGYLPSSLRPNEITRLLLNNLLSGRQKDKRLEAEERPGNIIYAIVGHTCSGKNVTARELKNRLGNAAEIIGNIKVRRKQKEKRPGEEEYSKDIYLDQEATDLITNGHLLYAKRFLKIDDDVVQALAISPYTYRHYRNNYYLQHTKITKTLKEGKEVILLTNDTGLEKIKEMKEREVIRNRMIIIGLHAPLDTSLDRLKERLDDQRIDEEEYAERTEGLEQEVERYRNNRHMYDLPYETVNRDDRILDVQNRVNDILSEKEKILEVGTVEERQSYVPSLVRKLTRLELGDMQEGKVSMQNMNMHNFVDFYRKQSEPREKVLKAINRHIITVLNNSGVYVMYLDGREETEEERRIFLRFLGDVLGEPNKKNEAISYYNTSQIGNSEVTYRSGGSVLKLSDVALYTVKPSERDQIQGNIPYVHSLAIVMLEDYDIKKGGLSVRGL